VRRNENFVDSSLWDFKSSFTCCKILRYGTFLLCFPSERKVCCGFLSPLKIHRLSQVQTATFGSSGKHTNHYTTKVTWKTRKETVVLDCDVDGSVLFKKVYGNKLWGSECVKSRRLK
jgi:hypothetical protein